MLFIPSSPRALSLLTKIFVTVLLVMYPVGIVLMLGGFLTPRLLWTTSVYLGVQFLVTLLHLLMLTEKRRTVVIAGIILAVSIAVEFVGASTGIPFGSYYYSYFLKPFVAGNVPLAISFAWFALVVNSFLVVKSLGAASLAPRRLILLSAVLIVGLDVLLEPFAAFVNGYWRWVDGSVPLQNYAGWLALGLLFSWMLSAFLRWRETPLAPQSARLPMLVLGLNAAHFTLINLLHGYWTFTLAGWGMVAVVLLLVKRSIRDGR